MLLLFMVILSSCSYATQVEALVREVLLSDWRRYSAAVSVRAIGLFLGCKALLLAALLGGG